MAEAEFQRENSVTETDSAGRSVIQDPAQTAQAGLGADEKKDMLEVLKGDLSRLEGKLMSWTKKTVMTIEARSCGGVKYFYGIGMPF
ncbi:unnamed protein product [Prunus armeniaca]|uniref:Uncharacterized protein n=1 Tax=Prunus armeniaca TaxID=36596 RepID=A0A6J5WB60_PRUAR|nr:unnamed protein product [Prunus armeniaca]